MTAVARNARQPIPEDSQMFAAGPDAARARFLKMAGAGTPGREELQRLVDSAVPALADWCALEVGKGLDQVAVHAPRVRTGGGLRLHARGLTRTAHRRVRLLSAGDESAVIAPLRAGGEVLGAIAFGYLGAEPDIRPERIDFIRTAASHLASALAAARPSDPLPRAAHAGLDIAACSRIAGGGSAGGDFHDLIEVDGGLVLAIGDVCGKGRPAAVPSARVRRTLHTLLEGRGPRDLPLSELNAAVRDLGGGAPFCTMALVGLERRAAGGFHAVVARAGHPHPLLVREGDGRLLGQTGDLLGVFDDARLDTEALDLVPGDTLVLYTDGLTDAHAPSEIIDVAALVPMIGAMSASPAATQLRCIEDATGVRGRTIRDDLSVLVVRVTA